jgi:hypothetical protein
MMAIPRIIDEDDPDDEVMKIGKKGSGIKCYIDVEEIDIPLADGVTVGATKYYRNRNRERSPRNYRHAHAYQRYWDPEDTPSWVEAMRQDSEWKARFDAWNLALSFGFEIDFLENTTDTVGEEEQYEEEEDEEQITPAAPARKKKKGDRIPSLIMADTGSPNDLIGLEDVPKGAKITKLDEDDQVELNTAGGTIFVDTITEISCEALNEISEPLVLADSSAVISIGKRVVHHGYDFVWRHGYFPYFKRADGTKIRMEIIVMYLTSGPDLKAGRLALLLWQYPKEQQEPHCHASGNVLPLAQMTKTLYHRKKVQSQKALQHSRSVLRTPKMTLETRLKNRHQTMKTCLMRSSLSLSALV